ncbi:glycoside hydrolase family 47 protein [Mycena albidolilacea]|uniref:alpha-1,2-Mannosidase n=1 Tax=Mycena albidolilacea TaxID=1033008 RepID=A0AAD7AT91_9AGAR|nr:glycoside hydrolase family 47 protein [Mycena albidolilacea]
MRLPILTLFGLFPYALAGVTVQKPGLTVPARYQSNRAAAEQIFLTSYNAYKKFAFGHDELLPISKTSGDDLGGWGASIVDAMSTMLVMGLDDLFNEAVNFSSRIDFNTIPAGGTISVFETTIRFVGGLLSAYELSGEKHPILVTKAKQVADKMAFAWVGDNDVPFGHIDFSDNAPQIAVTNIAEAGTLSLEWFTLSKFTGNATYADLTAKSVEHIANLGTPLPGLAPQLIDPSSGQFADAYITWGGGSDSYFEYLLKYARLTNTNNNIFIDTWKTAVDSSIKTLLKTSTVGNHVYLADLDDQGLIRHVGSHLACFHAGNWLLGGKLLNNQTIINIALELNDGCWNTYAGTATGIGPEGFAFISSDGNFTGDAITADEIAFYNKHGFYITASDYIQRPEVLESNFYAWRLTGDTKYLDRAAAAIASFNKFLPSPNGVGFACLNDVNNPAAGFIDDTESFWFAEVLKYLYLTFDDPEHISLDDYVFNTECHPLKAPPALNSYTGSGTLIPKKPFTAHTTSGPRPLISPI